MKKSKLLKYLKYALYTKKKYDKLSINDKVKYLNVQLWIICIIFSIVIVALVAIGVNILRNNNSPSLITTNVELRDKVFFMNNYSDFDKQSINELISGLKPEYQIALNKIYFTNNFSILYKYCPRAKGKTMGCSIPSNGEIFIYVDDAIYQIEEDDKIKTFVCHEILHSVIRTSENNHRIIYDLGEMHVCYKETRVSKTFYES